MITLTRSADKLELERLQLRLYEIYGEPSKLVRDATVGLCGTVRADGWRLEVDNPLIDAKTLMGFCDGFSHGWSMAHVELLNRKGD